MVGSNPTVARPYHLMTLSVAENTPDFDSGITGLNPVWSANLESEIIMKGTILVMCHTHEHILKVKHDLKMLLIKNGIGYYGDAFSLLTTSKGTRVIFDSIGSLTGSKYRGYRFDCVFLPRNASNIPTPMIADIMTSVDKSKITYFD